MKRISFALFILLIAVVCASAQPETIVPDNRYEGYPKVLIRWPTALPNMNACVGGEYYEPLDTHLTKYANRVKIAGYRILKTDECRWEVTRYGWRYILRPAGTKIAMDDQGRDLFDYGSPNGKVCTNPTPFGFPVTPPPPPPQAHHKAKVRLGKEWLNTATLPLAGFRKSATFEITGEGMEKITVSTNPLTGFTDEIEIDLGTVMSKRIKIEEIVPPGWKQASAEFGDREVVLNEGQNDDELFKNLQQVVEEQPATSPPAPRRNLSCKWEGTSIDTGFTFQITGDGAPDKVTVKFDGREIGSTTDDSFNNYTFKRENIPTGTNPGNHRVEYIVQAGDEEEGCMAEFATFPLQTNLTPPPTPTETPQKVKGPSWRRKVPCISTSKWSIGSCIAIGAIIAGIYVPPLFHGEKAVKVDTPNTPPGVPPGRVLPPIPVNGIKASVLSVTRSAGLPPIL